jgi:di/tricarboxylate transporter
LLNKNKSINSIRVFVVLRSESGIIFSDKTYRYMDYSSVDQTMVFATLAVVLFLFIWGRIRHDFVALIGLFLLVVAGIIPAEQSFSGFGHPAVITVAAVLIIGKALEYSGVVDVLGKWVMKVGNNLTVQILTLSLLVAVASAFMNNVGALALMMPIAIHMARKSGNPPSLLLMPIAFASLLGGMTTLVGTPPNIIIATFRAQETGEAFGMFNFAPVGVVIAIIGILFIGLLAWRFLPKRISKKSDQELFEIDDYITEVKVPKKGKIKGMSIKELMELTNADVQILGLVRNNKRIHAPNDDEVLQVDDIIILETDTESLHNFIDDTKLELVGGKQFRKDAIGSKDVAITEAIVMANSPLIGQSAAGTKMRSRYGINLLAVARKEEKIHRRLDHVIFRTGDVLLLHGRSHMIYDVITSMGFLPLARRGLRIGYKKNIPLSLGIFAASITLVVTGVLPVQVAFTMAAIAMILTGVLPIKEMYTSIDWPVIVLLAAMIPVGQALETTGGAAMIAGQIMGLGSQYPHWVMITIILVVTMFLSDIINNAATVVLMAPIGISVAKGLGVSIDPFLMAVAIGGSCAFLTPIGHQSNTLVMGPGGYRFSDYWRMGLPLEIIIVILGVPLLLYFWPL